jgi:hypothetical protein
VQAAEPRFDELFAAGRQLAPEAARSLLDGTGPEPHFGT